MYTPSGISKNFALYNPPQTICLPLLFADSTTHMLSLQVGPYSEVELYLSMATCTRHLPPPLAPPPTAPPELRPTSLIRFELGFAGGVDTGWNDPDKADTLAAAVRDVFVARLLPVAPPGFNATATAALVRRTNVRLLLAGRVDSAPDPPFAWLSSAMTTALPGCSASSASNPPMCSVDANALQLLEGVAPGRRRRRVLQEQQQL